MQARANSQCAVPWPMPPPVQLQESPSRKAQSPRPWPALPPGRRRKKAVEPDALNALRRHAWLGNVRELANVLERAQILADGETITLDDLPDTFQDMPDTPEGDPLHLHAVERRHVVELLRQHNGNKVHAARAPLA
jgi:transcriptional regulator of acetoin/glycerol metabolism